MEVVKKQSISRIFAKYIVLFCIVAIFLMLFDLCIFLVGAYNGAILPANYYEKQIENQRNAIAKVNDVKNIISSECSYAVYDSNGNILQGNVSKQKAMKIWNVIKNGNTSSGFRYYKTIQRKNDEICVVEYTLISTFANPILKKYIPNVELGYAFIFLILFIGEIVIFSKCFRRKLSNEMQILKDTTSKIGMKSLNFKVKYSSILEINEVLWVIDKMKTELHDSLNKQWRMEQVRKEQIAALAHDIKTPLTIIKGNSELLNELNLKADQKEFNDGILSAADNIESYTKSLMEIIKSEKETTIQKMKINSEKFTKNIIEQGVLMSMNKELDFISEIKDIPKIIFVDEMALKRAIINVISNSIDYCGLNGKILFYVDNNDKNIRFIIEDSGRGFTKEELNSATEQFFQGDKGRNSKNHYGMGLYIVRRFIEQYNGRMCLSNSEKLGGAKVILELPITLT